MESILLYCVHVRVMKRSFNAEDNWGLSLGLQESSVWSVGWLWRVMHSFVINVSLICSILCYKIYIVSLTSLLCHAIITLHQIMVSPQAEYMHLMYSIADTHK